VKDTGITSNPLSAGVGPVAFSVRSLIGKLESLVDHRGRRGRRYQLVCLLLFTTLAKLSGQDRPSGIARWIKYRRELLQGVLGISLPSTPHHNTYRRVFQNGTDPDRLDKTVGEFLMNLPNAGKSILLSFDGKTVRGTIDVDNPQGDHLLAAYLPEEGIVLFQVAVGSKENEISAAPKLLKAIDLRGKIVCADAEHTQRRLSAQILEAGGNYVWFVKDNQPTLREDIEQLFLSDNRTVLGGEVPNDFRTYRTVEKGHGRRETRRIAVSSELNDYSDWPGLQQVFKLERRRVDCKSGEVDEKTVYGVTSLSREEASPQRLLYLTRTYWGIENGLHNRRDVTFHEDATRLTQGHAGRVMAAINNLVIGLLRNSGYTNISDARLECDAKLVNALISQAASPLT
jgi:predicted transposase YbfD/YdcC